MIRKKILLKLLSLVFFIPLSLLARDEKKMTLTLSGYYDQVKISTTDSSNTSEGSDNLTIFGSQLALDYFFKENFSLTGKFFTSHSSDVQVESQGFSLGIKYYYYNLGYKSKSHIGNIIVETASGFSSFIGLNYGTEEYQYSLYSVNLKGFSLETGLDYSLSNDYLIRGSLYLKSQTDPSSIESNSIGLTLGIGYSF